MLRRYAIAILVVVLVMAIFVGACGSPKPTATPAPTATSSTATPTATSSTQTMVQLASAGQTVFAASCAKCHGAQGQGVTAPAVIGANARLDKYNTAQTLLSFISSSMPLNAPGSLSQQQYQQLLSFLLLRNNYAQASTPFDPNQLGNIQLKK